MDTRQLPADRWAWVEVDLDAIRRNVRAFKDCTRSGTRFCAVVKANAYGHGAVRVAQACRAVGVDMFAVATVAEALCKALDLKPGDKTFVMINGCGATTMMEMLVLFKDTVEFLKAKGVEVVASMVGEILTVQEAAGFQMNIAKWDDEFIRLWNTPCHTPAYSKE